MPAPSGAVDEVMPIAAGLELRRINFVTGFEPYGDPLTAPTGQGAADVWLIDVLQHRGIEEQLSLLDAGERMRCVGFRRKASSYRYAVAHVALRVLLGRYLAIPPAEIQITRGQCPSCSRVDGPPEVHGSGLYFSLSHGGDKVAIVFARVPVGVDVEPVPSSDIVKEVSGLMHPRERVQMSELAPDGWPTAFARCWTRSEAYLKATGEGVPGLGRTFVGAGAQPENVPGWFLSDIDVGPGYAAAAAVSQPRAVSRRPSGASSRRVQYPTTSRLGAAVPPRAGGVEVEDKTQKGAPCSTPIARSTAAESF